MLACAGVFAYRAARFVRGRGFFGDAKAEEEDEDPAAAVKLARRRAWQRTGTIAVCAVGIAGGAMLCSLSRLTRNTALDLADAFYTQV